MRGPYDTYEDFVSAMYDSITFRAAENVRGEGYTKQSLEGLLDFKPVLLQSTNSRPVLTHYDLNFPNIMVKPIMNTEWDKTIDFEVTIIDWATLAWLPAYIEPSGFQYHPLGGIPYPSEENRDVEKQKRLMRIIWPDWSSYAAEIELWDRVGYPPHA
jgi:hypothetical protein